MARPDPRQVHPGSRAAFEDQALLAVPVENGLHRVIDRQNETVVDANVAREIFAALGLDVIDLHCPERFDSRNLHVLNVLGGASWELKAVLELCRLFWIDESNLVGEYPA